MELKMKTTPINRRFLVERCGNIYESGAFYRLARFSPNALLYSAMATLFWKLALTTLV